EMAEEAQAKAPKVDPEQAYLQYRSAVQEFILHGTYSPMLQRFGNGSMPRIGKNGQVESRGILTTTPASSAPVGPSLFWADYAKALKASVSILDYGAKIVNSDNGNPFYIPFVNDTANNGSINTEAG